MELVGTTAILDSVDAMNHSNFDFTFISVDASRTTAILIFGTSSDNRISFRGAYAMCNLTFHSSRVISA